jgi:acetoin utilization protein AcuB
MAIGTPTVEKYMTPSPYSIGNDQTLATAHKIMRQHKIRHLPVLRGGKLIGLVTQRDLALIESLQDVDSEQVMVEDAMSTDVYTVDPKASLENVAATMAQHKYGCCVIMEHTNVTGIFTTIDACRALADQLHKPS